MLPDPGGSRQPPDKPPHTAVGLGGPDGEDARSRNWRLRKEALAIVNNLHDIANIIRNKLDQPADRQEYMALLDYCLRLIDEAMKLARGK